MSEEHSEALGALCRVCAKPVNRYRDRYLCCEYTEILKEVFLIEVSNDDDVIHPVQFCHCCYMTIQRAVVAQCTFIHTVSVYRQWDQHKDSECSTCDHMQEIKKGGRPKKRKRIGRPKMDGY